jgi:hypothetical protein
MKFFYKIIILLLIINIFLLIWQIYNNKIEHFADEDDSDDLDNADNDNADETKSTSDGDSDNSDEDDDQTEIGEVEDEEVKKLKDEIYGKSAEREQMQQRMFKQVYEEHISQLKPFKGFKDELKIVKKQCKNKDVNERFNRQDKVFSHFNYCDTMNKKPSFAKVITYLGDPIMQSHNYHQFDDYYAPYEIGKPVLTLFKPIPRSWNFSFKNKELDKDYNISTPEETYVKSSSDDDEEEEDTENKTKTADSKDDNKDDSKDDSKDDTQEDE